MKKALLFLLMISAAGVWGQTTSTLLKELNFEQETDEQEISFPVNSNISQLSFSFAGQISSGSLKAYIFDPNGKREGGFHLEALTKGKKSNTNSNSNDNQTFSYTVTSDKNSNARGDMNKTVQKPISGTWTVKIISDKLTGMFAAEIGQMVE